MRGAAVTQKEKELSERGIFLYAIQDVEGRWKDGESCVFGDEASCQSAVDYLNDDIPVGIEEQYSVVPLVRASSLHEATRQASQLTRDILMARFEEAQFVRSPEEAKERCAELDKEITRLTVEINREG
jgi:hypothetical protein